MQFDPSAINREATDTGNEVIEHPFREACSLVLYTFAWAIFGVVVRLMFSKLFDGVVVLHGQGFYLIIAGTVTIVSVIAFVYTCLGSVCGRRRARNLVKGAIVAIALTGLSVGALITNGGH